MATHSKDDDQGFLSRWSRRKRAAEEEAARDEASPDAGAPRDADAPDAEPEPVDPADLPDIDSLDEASDFSVFMRPGVPSVLKQRALRRLWQVDPAFKHICMLDDYNLDYTDAATVVPNLKTIYQVGRGMVLNDEPPAQAAAARPEEAAAPDTTAPLEAPRQAAEEAPSAEETLAAPQQEPSLERPELDDSEPDSAQPAAAATRRSAAPTDSPRATGRSARQRRWGDSGQG